MPRIYLASLAFLLFAQSDSGAADTQRLQLGPGYTECGILKKFWRARPIIGRWMSEGFLSQAPDFYNSSSFPYIRRRYRQEVTMADCLTTPRLLGGWHPDKGGKGELARHKRVADADLVYRKGN